MTDNLEAVSVADLRRRRDSVRDREAALSYRRRLLQAQMDIVDQLGRGETGDLQTQIGHALADEPSGTQAAARAVDMDAHPELDVEPLPLDITSWDADQRAELLRTLAAAEAEASRERRSLLDQLDALQAELVQRYRTDGVDAASLLSGDAT